MFLMFAAVGIVLLLTTVVSDRCDFDVTPNGGLNSMGLAAFVAFFGCAAKVSEDAGYHLVAVLGVGLLVGFFFAGIFSAIGSHLRRPHPPPFDPTSEEDDDPDFEVTA